MTVWTDACMCTVTQIYFKHLIPHIVTSQVKEKFRNFTKQWLARLQKKWALPCPQLSHKTTLHSSPLCQLMVSETGEKLMRYSSILYHCKCSLATPQFQQWTLAWTCSAITHTYILCPGPRVCTVMVELLGNIEHTVFASIIPNRQYSSCLLSLCVNG